jgi:hypothetical protein
MLKKSSSFVLASLRRSTYGKKYTFASSLAAASAWKWRVSAPLGWVGAKQRLFEHPVLQVT